MTLSRDVAAIRVITLHKLKLRDHMVEATVVNPHTHDWDKGSFELIDMVHELELLSGDSVRLTLTRTESGSKLAQRRMFAV